MRLIEFLRKEFPNGYASDTGWYNGLLCKYHNERTPSAGIHLERSTFHCFGCNINVSLPEFIAKYKDIPLHQAQQEASQLELGFTPNDASSPGSSSITYRMQPTLRGKGYDYWLSRGLSEITILTYRLGYDEAEDAVTIPLHDPEGNFLGLILRYLDGRKNKYHYPKGSKISHLLWGYHYHKYPLQKLYVVEGPIDAIVLSVMGYPTIALMGSNCTPHQAQLIEATGCDEFTYIPDSDGPGALACDRFIDYNNQRLAGRVTVGLLPPDVKDANDAYLKGGPFEITLIQPYTWRELRREADQS